MYLEYSFVQLTRMHFEKIVDGSLSQYADFIAVSNSTDTLIRFFYLKKLKRSVAEKNIPPLDSIDWLFTRCLIHQTRNEFTVSLFMKTIDECSGRRISESDSHVRSLNEDAQSWPIIEGERIFLSGS